MKLFASLILGAFLILSYQNCSKTGGASFGTSNTNAGDLNSDLDDPLAGAPECSDLTTDEVQPVVRWDWQDKINNTPEAARYATFNQTMSSPVVGDVDGDGLPEVVTIMFSRTSSDWFSDSTTTVNASGNSPLHTRNGALRVIDGATGNTQFSIVGDASDNTNKDIAPLGHNSPLLVDLDGNGSKEIIYLHYLRESAIAINGDGSSRWVLPLGVMMDSCQTGFSSLQMDQGGAEVIIGNRIFGENALGNPVVKATIPGIRAESCDNYAMSLNAADPAAQIISDTAVYKQDGTKVFDIDSGRHSAADVRPDVAGLEIVTILNGVISMVNGTTGAELFSSDLNANQALKCTNRTTVGGGPATIGNFDANPDTIEIATATGRYLTILNHQGQLIDQFETQDCSSQKTGITSFDFNGDERPEILYTDEEYMRVFEIRDGKLTEIFKVVNPSGTLFEYPVVADIDGDASAEIVMVSNNYPTLSATSRWYSDPGEEADKAEGMTVTGIRAFEPKVAGSWMNTRSSWHQYWFSYSMLDDTNKVVASTAVDGSEHSFNRNKQGGIFKPFCYPK